MLLRSSVQNFLNYVQFITWLGWQFICQLPLLLRQYLSTFIITKSIFVNFHYYQDHIYAAKLPRHAELFSRGVLRKLDVGRYFFCSSQTLAT